MRLRTIIGNSVPDAMRRVQMELGPNAFVLETHSEKGSTRIVAADVEREEPAEGLMRLRAELALLRHELVEGRSPAQRPASEIQPRLRLVEARLTEQGLAPSLLTRVLTLLAAAPESEGDPISPVESLYCRNAVAGLVPDPGAIKEQRPRCFAFVGPPGAGKTTTIAKVAEQTRKENASLGLITLDSMRPGAAELLASVAERLGIPFRSVRGPDSLDRAMREFEKISVVLVDTIGVAWRERAPLDALRERLPPKRGLAVHLVLPAHVESTSLRSTARAYQDLSPAAIVFTRVDETERLGSLINLPAELSIPVAALTYGTSLAGDLAAASRILLADLVLGRRNSQLKKTET